MAKVEKINVVKTVYGNRVVYAPLTKKDLKTLSTYGLFTFPFTDGQFSAVASVARKTKATTLLLSHTPWTDVVKSIWKGMIDRVTYNDIDFSDFGWAHNRADTKPTNGGILLVAPDQDSFDAAKLANPGKLPATLETFQRDYLKSLKSKGLQALGRYGLFSVFSDNLDVRDDIKDVLFLNVHSPGLSTAPNVLECWGITRKPHSDVTDTAKNIWPEHVTFKTNTGGVDGRADTVLEFRAVQKGILIYRTNGKTGDDHVLHETYFIPRDAITATSTSNLSNMFMAMSAMNADPVTE